MRKTIGFLLAASLTIGIALPNALAASSYKVQKGDSLWKIANEFGLSVLDLQAKNNIDGSLIYPDQMLDLPATITQEEKELMAKLVHAEAVGEPYAGKVAVATVILNRVDHPDFPNTVKEVIYEKSHGHYAFTPVQNGTINEAADAESMKAVNEALAYRGQGNGSIYFYNPKTAKSDWILSRDVTLTIGNHTFAK